jgi:hypothetical protein
LEMAWVVRRLVGEVGDAPGYGYWLSPYGTAYRRALPTTRTRLRTRVRI